MDTMNKRVNRDILLGWSIIALVLVVSYIGEVIKGERTLGYVVVFLLVTVVPLLMSWIIYFKKTDMKELKYIITAGYFCMYVFSLITGSTPLVFTYIFPLLSLIILYHKPKLVAIIGISSIILNALVIVNRIYLGEITMANSKDAEIQIALIILCFTGCFIGTMLYDAIQRKNGEYARILEQKNAEIQELTLQTITTIAKTIDAKDEYTKGHSQRVSAYASAIAREMGWSEDEVNKIRYIALLHDIGKIGVPDNVLNKPGKLTDVEYELMKKHTIIGGEILNDTGMFDGISLGARYHHERYDGKGYPKGLEGDEIPIIARIICVADAYDAMTSTRVYRKRLSDEVAKEEIQKCKGKQFDPEIADVFLKSLEEGRVAAITSEYDKAAEEIDAGHKLWQKIVDTQKETSIREKELDHLTAVYNRSTGERKISASIQEKHGCLMMLDITNMVRINQKKGALFGDHCITVIADIVSHIAPNAIVARYGGAEFICFFEGIKNKEDAEQIAKDILAAIDVEIEKNPGMEELLVSIGIVLTLTEGTEYSKLINCVDKALYHIKQKGGQGYYLYRGTKVENEQWDSKIDLKNIVEVLKNISKKKETVPVNYPEFERMYQFVEDVSDRNEQEFCVVMFSIKVQDSKSVTVEERDLVMDYVEKAIVTVLRTTEGTIRYSSTQQLLILVYSDENSVKAIIEKILSEFYKIYTGSIVSLEYVYEIFDERSI